TAWLLVFMKRQEMAIESSALAQIHSTSTAICTLVMTPMLGSSCPTTALGKEKSADELFFLRSFSTAIAHTHHRRRQWPAQANTQRRWPDYLALGAGGRNRPL